MAAKCEHLWGRWGREKDKKGYKYFRRCLFCGKKEVRRRATLQAKHDIAEMFPK